MPPNDLFSPERLKLARQRRGFYVQELAGRVGVTPKTVSRWERGERSPEDENIVALARELNFPRDHFFGDAPPVLENWAFRSLARVTARQRTTAIAAGSYAVCLDQWLDQHIARPEIDVPDLAGQSPEGAADSLRAAWGLGYRPLPNLVHLLESRGVRVYSLVHDGADFDAFSVWYDQVPYVFLNTSVTPERGRMDAAHETGHLVLHAHTGGGETKEENTEANVFASAFLMPASAFIASAPHRITFATVVEAKQQWGVSALSYVRRLHTLGRITDWQYKSLCIDIKTRFRKSEPGPARAPETSKVLSWVFSSSESGITRRDVVRQLKIPMADLDDMTFGLALTAVAGGGGDKATVTTTPRPDLRLMK